MTYKSDKQKEQEKRAYEAYRKQTRLNAKGFVKDKYPNVEYINYDLTYKSEYEDTIKKTGMGPDSFAEFIFKCLNHECIDGGHDLDTVVSQMITNKQTELSDSHLCQGWEDRERVNQHHCWCEMEYKITIKYKDQA